MNPLGKKIYLYNVTMGLYMLDWWERYLFNVLILVLLWFICYNGSRFVTQIYNSNFSADFMASKKFGIAGVVPT